MASQQPLSGIRVHLAGAISAEATKEETDGIHAFVEAFTRAVLSKGGTVVHGSHPSLIEPLRRAAESYIDENGRRDALELVRTADHATTPEQQCEVEAQRRYAVVQIIPFSPGRPTESLVPMREWIAERCDLVVAVAGVLAGVNPLREGVPLELDSMLTRGKAGFALAGFGGAVRRRVEEDETLFGRLRNGMAAEANHELAALNDPAELTRRLIAQIQRLPLVRESVKSGRFFRILTLDGGGLRGAFTAAVLSKWAAMLGDDTGLELVKHFDLVAGTSTGSLLALGLGLGHPPLKMLEFYREQGAVIFPERGAIRPWFKSKFDSGTLKEVLQGVFKTDKLRDSACRLVIPTVTAKQGNAEVIVTPHSADRTGFGGYSAVDAALASSAAPTYFDEAEFTDEIASQQYLDGGIWANNPTLPALAEAVSYLGVPLERIDVLSVGTLRSEADFSGALGKGKLGWAAKTADLFFAAQEGGAVTLADRLLTGARYLRVNADIPAPIDLANVKAVKDMASLGARVGEKYFPVVRSRFLDGFHAPDWRPPYPRA